ncbi:O-methyltransferase [Bermanella sp. WJH001]|uniref:O-methyltransferase n=1 Tax=Bermanella sp. WJH001 TaxID=3048005 RepID=UPI0024BE3C2A|nr:class I SAM-dependent methyltransferase [Bermanella sp. WJH001]MDJ1539427.1 class I SAM-dependent methyltransferase [Bermanella sp. WJH001]
MTKRTLEVSDSLYEYLLQTSSRESDVLKELAAVTAKDPMARMQIASEQGQFMGLLVKLIGARNIIEVGTFTGYSSICMAQNMVRPARIVCCDLDEHWTNIAQQYWKKAGVEDICELTLAPALDTLTSLIKSGQQRTFDLAFIDADKENYDHYYEACLKLIRPGGLILIDNTLWGGRVADRLINDVDTQSIRALNAKLQQDNRIELSQLPIADGLTLCLKK